MSIYDEKIRNAASREATCKPILRNKAFKVPQIDPLNTHKSFTVGCHAIDFKLPALAMFVDTMKAETRGGQLLLLMGHPPSSGEEWTMHSSLSSFSSSFNSSFLKELDRLSSQPAFNQSTISFLSSILARPTPSSFLPPLVKCGESIHTPKPYSYPNQPPVFPTFPNKTSHPNSQPYHAAYYKHSSDDPRVSNGIDYKSANRWNKEEKNEKIKSDSFQMPYSAKEAKALQSTACRMFCGLQSIITVIATLSLLMNTHLTFNYS